MSSLGLRPSLDPTWKSKSRPLWNPKNRRPSSLPLPLPQISCVTYVSFGRREHSTAVASSPCAVGTTVPKILNGLSVASRYLHWPPTQWSSANTTARSYQRSDERKIGRPLIREHENDGSVTLMKPEIEGGLGDRTMRIDDRAQVARLTSESLELLQLDDIWTAAVQQISHPTDDVSFTADEIISVVEQMLTLLQSIGEQSDFLHQLGENVDESDEDVLNSLLWGDELGAQEQSDLRWMIARQFGLSGLIHTAADGLADYEVEISNLRRDLLSFGQGETVEGDSPSATVEGDLSRKFRCNLGLTLIGGGILSMPATATGATAAGVALGATVGGAVLVGATGGIAGLAVIVAGIFFIRKSKC